MPARVDKQFAALTRAFLCATIFAVLPLGALCGCDGSAAQGAESPRVDRAIATLQSVGDSGVQGTVEFERTADGVRVTGRITGLTPGAHGFHVHEYGDLSDVDTGASAGDHFCTRGMPHGSRASDQRHVGDLGNVFADDQGVASIDFTDQKIGLDGASSILGRAIVVHANEDRFTQPSGDSGDRVAFGLIGVAKPRAGS